MHALKKWLKYTFYFDNHWKCFNKLSGHCILFGFQYSTYSYNMYKGDYYAYRYKFDFCILGFEVGFRVPERKKAGK